MRVYILKCTCMPIPGYDPDNGETVETVTIDTRECVTVSDMVENFNKLLAVMGFVAKVDVAEDDE